MKKNKKGRPRIIEDEVSINFTISRVLQRRIDLYITTQAIAPSRAAVTRLALEKFLPIERPDKTIRTWLGK